MDIETAVAGALVRAQSQVTLPASVTGIAGLFGAGSIGKAGLAQALVELGVSKSYATARRNIDRYMKAEAGTPGQTRHPNAKTQAALEALAKTRIDRATIAAIKREGVRVDFSGSVVVSPGGRRPDERDRDIQTYIPPEEAAPFLDALIRRDLENAGDYFNEGFMQSYGLRDAYITDVSDLHFFIGQ